MESQRTSNYFSIGVAKNSSLKDLLNTVLLALIEDGSLGKIEDKLERCGSHTWGLITDDEKTYGLIDNYVADVGNYEIIRFSRLS